MIISRIPGKLNNRTLVGFIDRLRRLERVVPRDFSGNDLTNREAFERRTHGDSRFRTALIEQQAAFTDMCLGKSTLDYSGCEVIAVYNLLLSYDGGSFSVSLPSLIEIFEKNGIVHAGRFGVSPRTIRDYLRGIGLRVNYSEDESDFDVLGYFCDHFILTVMNDRRNIFRQIHSFYVSREARGLVAHNAGIVGYFENISSLIGALPGGKAGGVCLIGLKEAEE